jgi:hypothetical protein
MVVQVVVVALGVQAVVLVVVAVLQVRDTTEPVADSQEVVVEAVAAQALLVLLDQGHIPLPVEQDWHTLSLEQT